jgi:hypothetical protein
MIKPKICSFFSVGVLLASTAAAQVLQSPARSARDVSERTKQGLTVEGNLLGGYEDNLVPPTGGDALAPHPSGYTGFSDATLTYTIGNMTRSLEAGGGAYMTTYRNIGVGPRYGGDQRLRGRTALGRRTELTASQELRYAPQFSLGLFGAVQPDLGQSNTENVTNSLGDGGSWTTAASASVVRQLTRRSSLDGGYSFGRQRYVDDSGFDSRTQSGTLGYKHAFGRAAGLRAVYQYRDGEFEELRRGFVPIVTHTADLGFTYQRRLSLTREMSFSAGGGAGHVETTERLGGAPAEYWTPSAFGTARLDVGRSWSLSGDYRRSTTVLQGATAEPYAADTAQISVGGDLQRWLETVFTVGYGSGVSGQSSQDLLEGRYDAYTAGMQMRFRLPAGWSSIVSFTHFDYRLNAVASRLLDAASDVQRNTVRVGLGWKLPLYTAK